MKRLIGSLLTVWFGLVVFFGAQGAFVRSPETPPLPILFGFLVPLLVSAVWYWGSSKFRKTVLGADLRLLTAIQAWRAGGLGFLALSANGVLPGLFAWPAGLGDIAIGVTAPWVALALVQNPRFVRSRFFAVWNLLGILDLVVAVSMGALERGIRARTGIERHDSRHGKAAARAHPGVPGSLVRDAACDRIGSSAAISKRRVRVRGAAITAA